MHLLTFCSKKKKKDTSASCQGVFFERRNPENVGQPARFSVQNSWMQLSIIAASQSVEMPEASQ